MVRTCRPVRQAGAVPLPTRWITDALAGRGPRPPLEVLKAVWHAHEAEILAGGDLLYTWQVDLHATAEAMAERGELVVDTGTWALPDAARTARRGWHEDEVAVAVRTYLALLRAAGAGQPVGGRAAVAQVASETGRSEAQVEALMANVSAVVQEHGLQPLAAFPPRSNVPVGVRPVVAAALGV